MTNIERGWGFKKFTLSGKAMYQIEKGLHLHQDGSIFHHEMAALRPEIAFCVFILKEKN